METGRRLVVDVGGGSTELIVGEGLKTQQLVSLYMGCVGMSDEYFGGGRISSKRLQRACLAARMELQPVAATLRKLGWQEAFGTSGTVQTTAALLRELGLSAEGITHTALERLATHLTEHELVSDLRYDSLSAQRAPVYMGGLAILLSVFEALDIERMRVSDGALREGLALRHARPAEPTRMRACGPYARCRCAITWIVEQAERTEALALSLLEQIAGAWKLELPLVGESLRWAARLHELGLAIAHAQYHKHGGYLLEHADMAGFSRHEQMLVARLVRAHRRKIAAETFTGLPAPWSELLPRAVVLLRLAVLLNRSRTATQVPAFELEASASKLSLRFAEGWLDQHPLTRADLEREVEYLRAIDLTLDFA